MKTIFNELIFDRSFGNLASPEQAKRRIKYFYGFICLQRKSGMQPFEAYRFIPFEQDYSWLNETFLLSKWEHETSPVQKRETKSPKKEEKTVYLVDYPYVRNPANWTLTLSSPFNQEKKASPGIHSTFETYNNEVITVTMTLGRKRKIFV